MKLEISFNDQPKGIELVFSEEPSKVLALRLKAYGFKKGFLVPLKWTAAQHPAYITYAKALKESLLKKKVLFLAGLVCLLFLAEKYTKVWQRLASILLKKQEVVV